MKQQRRPDWRETLGESLIREAREEYADGDIEIDQFEEKVEEALEGDARRWHPKPTPPPTYTCPWCHAVVMQSRTNFNWWCPGCGKNATDHPDWNGVE